MKKKNPTIDRFYKLLKERNHNVRKSIFCVNRKNPGWSARSYRASIQRYFSKLKKD